MVDKIQFFSIAKENGLKRMSGTNWFGCLFLNMNTEADEKKLHEGFTELTQQLAAVGCTEDNLTHVSSKRFSYNCNWKVRSDIQHQKLVLNSYFCFRFGKLENREQQPRKLNTVLNLVRML